MTIIFRNHSKSQWHWMRGWNCSYCSAPSRRNHMIKMQVLGSPPAWEFQLSHLPIWPPRYPYPFSPLLPYILLLQLIFPNFLFWLLTRGRGGWAPELRWTSWGELGFDCKKKQGNKKHPQTHSVKKNTSSHCKPKPPIEPQRQKILSLCKKKISQNSA